MLDDRIDIQVELFHYFFTRFHAYECEKLFSSGIDYYVRTYFFYITDSKEVDGLPDSK